MLFRLIFVLFLVISFQARAGSLGLETTQGVQSNSYEVSASGDFGDSKEPGANTYDWNISGNRSKSEVKNTSGEVITDNTTDFIAGTGLEMLSHLRIGAAFSYSVTPEEKLRSSGPSLSFGYTHSFTIEEKKVAGAEAAVPATTGFVPYLAVDFNFQNLDYVQTFDTKGQRRLLGPAMPVTGKNTINQKSSQLTIRGKPVSWARVKASYTKYTYSRDVSDFIQFLDTHNLVGNLSSGFSSALSGFYDNTVSFGISFFPHRDWELALSRSSSKVIYDESVSTTDKLVGYWDFRESWRLGLGQSVTKSNGPGSEASTYSIVSVDYDF